MSDFTKTTNWYIKAIWNNANINSELKKSQELVQQLTEIANQTEIKMVKQTLFPYAPPLGMEQECRNSLKHQRNRNKFLTKKK